MKTNIAHGLKKYLPHLLQAQQDNLTEADTLQRIVKVFEDVLGYDPFTEISRELEVKSKYVDLAIKIDGTIKFFVEVKAAGKKLRDRHVAQGELYAAEGNIPWVLVTNGVEWNLYHLTIEEGVDFERVFSVTLAPETIEESAEKLVLLHRNSVKAGAHERFWERQTALSPATIGRAIFTEDVLRHIRKEIHQRQDILIDIEDLAGAIHDLLTTTAKELIGPPKVRYHKQAVKQGKTQPPAAVDPTAASGSVSQSPDQPSASP
ncbi:MAG TPA: type I restriction enzyme HsdR N-terminal domain-containing protein [Verrucomicrobiae bacterium]|nr:type I restriction enzyme HsdR N-terminal domain-containing protein [Verrucomicrobiae bacterium]